MDSMLTKAGSFLFVRRAKKEMDTFGDDMNSMSTTLENSAKNFFNRMKGKIQKPLPELLQSFDLPKGLFPKNATNYEFEEATGKLTVFVPETCEVGFRDSSVVRYAVKVTGILTQGKLSDIEGMKTKFVFWIKVTMISMDEPPADKVYFHVGMRRARPKVAYESLRDGIEVDEF
eukprot:TRINITY_DN6758_c0_g1_i1.p1 TRINITY_DN6758_c0_g1~~TRINITY_DN6758_c0_g1_i1.p1  ORF type:complete len:174 (+),score=35.97 TRINITY_DN6758_c0_g1_i1:270-791(+)